MYLPQYQPNHKCPTYRCGICNWDFSELSLEKHIALNLKHYKVLNVDPVICIYCNKRKFYQDIIEEEKRNDELVWALRTRILSDEEMAEVGRLGYWLLVKHGDSFNQTEIEKLLNEHLLQQFRLRTIQQQIK